MLGADTSQVEVTHISRHGIWIISARGEQFLSFDDFPWFKDEPVSRILNIEEPTPGHFYWPELDVDLSYDIIEHPERFPLKFKKAGQAEDK